MHLDRGPQPPDVAVPRHIVCFPQDDDDVHQPDGGGGDDEQAGGEEGYEVDFLGCADAEGEERAERDEEDDNVHEDVEGGADDHVDALVDAGADGVGDEDFPVVLEGSDGVREGCYWREGAVYRHWRKRTRKAAT